MKGTFFFMFSLKQMLKYNLAVAMVAVMILEILLAVPVMGFQFDEPNSIDYNITEDLPEAADCCCSCDDVSVMLQDALDSINEETVQEEFLDVSVNSVSVPTVSTHAISDSVITTNSAYLIGGISDTGGGTILARAFGWGPGSAGDNFVLNVVVDGNSFYYHLTGLSPGTTYYYRAWAQNSAGWGYGTVQSFTTKVACSVSRPSRPSGVTSGFTNTSYTYTSGGSSCAAGHSVQYRFSWVKSGSSARYSSWSSSSSYTFNFSEPGTYEIDVQARCTHNTSVVSSWSSVRTVSITNPVQKPTVVTHQVGSDVITANSAYIIGGIEDTGGGTIINRAFGWGPNSVSENAVINVTVSGNTFSYQLTGLAPDTTYYYVASAENSAGWGFGEVRSFKTKKACSVTTPVTPTGPATGETGIAYTYSTGGSACAAGHALEYRLQWKKGTDPSSYSAWSSATSIALTFDAAGAYQVSAQARCAFDNNVTSGWSAPVAVTIDAPVSVPVVLTQQISEQVATATTAYLIGGIADDGGAAITHRAFGWGETAVSENAVIDVTVDGDTFYYHLTGLTPATTYVYVASASNSAGWGFGETISFTTNELLLEQRRVGNTNGLGLRLRATPDLSASVLTVMPEGALVSLLGDSVSAGGYNWLKVDYNGMIGWAVALYLFDTEGSSPPALPAGLSQFNLQGVSVPAGGTLDQNSIALRGVVTDPQGAPVKLQIEVRPVGEAFSRSTQDSAFVTSGETAEVIVSGLPNGSYRWRARVVGENGMVSDWVSFADGATAFIVENLRRPTAIINISGDQVIEGNSLSFNGTSSLPAGEIATYSWNLGNGVTRQGETFNYTYPETGTYTISLTVTTTQGHQDTATREVQVVSRALFDAVNSLVSAAINNQNYIYNTSRNLSAATSYFLSDLKRAEVQTGLDFLEQLDYFMPPGFQLAVSVAGFGKDALLRRLYTNNERLDQIYHPKFEAKLADHEQQMTAYRNQILQNLPDLNEAEIDDAVKRIYAIRSGIMVLSTTYSQKALFLTTLAECREIDEASWTYNVGKRGFWLSLGALVGLISGGQGLAPLLMSSGMVSASRSFEGAVRSYAQQNSDAVLYSAGIQMLNDGYYQLDLINQSARLGMDIIGQIADSKPLASLPEGRITQVQHKGDGLRIRQTYFNTRNAYSLVTIRNTGQEWATYRLFAVYDQRVTTTQLFAANLPFGIGERGYDVPIVYDQRGISLAPSSQLTLRVNYMQNGSGNIPKKPIGFNLLAVDDNDLLYQLDVEISRFGTTLIEEGVELPEEEAGSLELLTYPIYSAVSAYFEDGAVVADTYLLRLWVHNPFAESYVFNLAQELPDGLTLVHFDEGLLVDNKVYWDLDLEPGEHKIFDLIFNLPTGTPWPQVPEADLLGYQPSSDDWLIFRAMISEEPVEFSDEALEALIRAEIGLPAPALVYPVALGNLTLLDGSGQAIASLFGLEHAPGLERLDLSNNELTSIYPISGLIALSELDLSNNQLDDITPLTKLTGLERLNLSHNLVADLAVLGDLCSGGGLGSGSYVDLRYNRLDLSPGSEAMETIIYLESCGVAVEYEPQSASETCDFYLKLERGWNLVSTKQTAVDVVFEEPSALYIETWLTYDNGIWSAGAEDLKEAILNPARAVFIKVAEPTTVGFNLAEENLSDQFAQHLLTPGWNLISSGIKADHKNILSDLFYNGTSGLTQLFAPNSYNGRKSFGYHLPWDNPLVSLTTPAQGSGEHMYPFDGYWVYLRGAGVTYSTPVGSDLPGETN
jgi:hypothetical protein